MRNLLLSVAACSIGVLKAGEQLAFGTVSGSLPQE